MSEGSEPLRLFVAVGIPADARRSLVAALAPVRRATTPGAVGWVPEARMHLTLRFLGNVLPQQLPELRAGLDAVGAIAPPLPMILSGLGAFPSLARPRVLWVGVESNVRLAALYQKVDDLCDAVGVERERRPFRPHLTVGRVRPGRHLPEIDPSSFTSERWSVAVRSLDLMASELAPGGARYRRLHAAALRGAEAI